MSSEQFCNKKFEELLAEHDRKAKRILKKNISKNKNTLNRYLFDILTSHNNFVQYINIFYIQFKDDSLKTVNTKLRNLCEKTEKCYNRLHEENDFNEIVEFPENLLIPIEIKVIYDPDIDASDAASSTEGDENNSEGEDDQSNLTIIENSVDGNGFESAHEHLNSTITNNSDISTGSGVQANCQNKNNQQASKHSTIKMAYKENREYLSFLDRTIKSYAGDPLTLKSFINRIDLAKLSTEDEQKILLKSFVVSRLEGKALECVDTSKSLEEILKTLESCIKPDSSKVVEGKILSLRFNKSNSTDFSKQAEELAEALQRSLVIEGYSLEKAKELTIERTVEMCRQNARNESVKTVLAAKDFKDPKEVVAKLIVQENSVEKERQVLFFNKNGQNRQNKPFFKKYNGNNGHNGYNGNGYKNNWNRGGNSRGRFQCGRGLFGGNRGSHNRQYNVRMAENCDGPSVSRREAEAPPNEPAFTLMGVNRN